MAVYESKSQGVGALAYWGLPAALVAALTSPTVAAWPSSWQGELAGSEEHRPSWSSDVRPILSEHCFACHGPDPSSRAAGVRFDTRAGLLGSDALDLASPDDSELLYRVTSEDDFDHMPPPGNGRDLRADEVEVLRKWIESGAEWEAHWAYAPFATEPTTAEAEPTLDSFVQARLGAVGLELNPEASPRDLLRRLFLDVTGLPPSAEEIASFESDPSEQAYEGHVDALLGSVEFGEHWARHWLDLARYADSHGYTIDGGRSIWPWRDWAVQAIASDMPFSQFTIEQLAGDLLPNPTRGQRVATGFHRNTQVNQEGGAKDEENRINAVIDRTNTTGSVWLGSSVGCAQCHTHKFDPITHSEYFGLYAFFNSTEDGGVSQEPTLLVPRNGKEEAQASAWEKRLAEAEAQYRREWGAASAGWTLWQPERATGSNGPELRPELSGAYRLLGQHPVFSTYVLEGSTPGIKEVGAVRLEVLADGGPGRNGKNFVLQEVRLASRGENETEWTAHPFRAARADFEQDTSEDGGGRYPATSLLDSEGPGWAIKPQFDSPHVLELEVVEPFDVGGRELRVELVQEFGANHTLGTFRMGLAPRPVLSRSDDELVPKAWVDAWLELKKVRGERPRLPSTLVLEERPVPRPTRRFERGSFLDQRETVTPRVPAAMDHFSDPEKGMATRLDLARWLVDPANALVHRVTVNRFWQQLFGVGIVPSENDFGLRGVRPTHPDLLEWLAKDFVAHGMSRRHTLRTILLSKTYRQSDASSPAKEASDPGAALLSRRLPMRLSGEVLRDSMLVASGVLDPTVGGGPVQPPQPGGVFSFTQSRKSWTTSEGSQRFRRSLYTRIWRSSPFPFYSTFDAPSPGFSCSRRTVSSSPLQALALANDPLVVEISEAMGDRLIREFPDATFRKRVGALFLWALGRSATDEEASLLSEHAQGVEGERGETAACAAMARVVFNLYEFTHRP